MVVETPEASNDSSRARSPFPCLPSTTIYSFLQLKQLHTNLLCCASSQLGLGLIQFSVFFLVLRRRWGRKGLIRFLLFGRMLSPVVISLLEVALECPGQEHWDQKSKQIYGVIDCIGCCQYPAKPYPCLLLETGISRQFCEEESGGDPSSKREQPSHAVQNRQQSTHRQRKYTKSTDQILAQHLEREKKQMGCCSSHSHLVSSREPSQYIGQWQKQACYGSEYNVYLK